MNIQKSQYRVKFCKMKKKLMKRIFCCKCIRNIVQCIKNTQKAKLFEIRNYKCNNVNIRRLRWRTHVTDKALDKTYIINASVSKLINCEIYKYFFKQKLISFWRKNFPAFYFITSIKITNVHKWHAFVKLICSILDTLKKIKKLYLFIKVIGIKLSFKCI